MIVVTRRCNYSSGEWKRRSAKVTILAPDNDMAFVALPPGRSTPSNAAGLYRTSLRSAAGTEISGVR